MADARCACGQPLGRITFVTSVGRQLCGACGRRRLIYLRTGAGRPASAGRPQRVGEVVGLRRQIYSCLMLTRAAMTVVLSSLGLLIVGCGGHAASSNGSTAGQTQQPQASPADSSQHGFLALASNGALFIQWTRTGDSLQGTLSEAYTSQSDATQSQSESHSFTGVVSGSNVTLTLDSGVNWNGTLKGSSNVTLSYAGSDGSLRTFDFHQASVSDYNAAVGNVHASAGQAQAQKTQQAAQQQVDGDSTAVANDLSDLQSNVSSLKSSLTKVPGDIAQMRQDLATEVSDLNKVLSDSAATVCNDNYQVSGTDSYQVTGTDDYQVTGTDEYDFSTALSGTKDSIDRVSADLATLRRDSAVASGYLPVGTPTTASVASATQNARTSVVKAQGQWNGYLATVKQLDAKATTYGAQADAACNKAGG
jgi:hypothetical protein